MKQLADILPGVVEFRHRLHQIPELAGEEFETSRLIRERIAGLGLELLPPLLGTDVVALLRGPKPGRNVTLRADIDALAVTEETGVDYASQHPGRMHACGHDAHTAMLLGAAELLAARRDEIAGSVRFVWQPGEENRALGRDLVAKGVLDDPPADLAATLHGMPDLPTGVLGFRSGASEASCSHFKLTVRGCGGHSSRPQLARDPVLAAAALVVELQSVVSRRIDPMRSAVLSICRIAGGELANVIPDAVELEGTARALDQESADELERGVREIAEAVCRAHRCACEVDYRNAYPVVYNDPEVTDLARRVARETLGEEFVYERPEPSMGADDFAYYAQKVPSVYVKIGAGCAAGLHNAKYLFPDAAMRNGILFLTEFALAGLRG